MTDRTSYISQQRQSPAPEVVWSEAFVCKEILGVSRGTLRKWVADGVFPRPIKLSPHRTGRVGWLRSTVEAWLRSRPAAGDADHAA